MTGGSITITGDGNPTPGSGPYPFGGGSPDSIVAAAGVLTNSEGQATPVQRRHQNDRVKFTRSRCRRTNNNR